MNAFTSKKQSGTGGFKRSWPPRRKKPWPKACWTRLKIGLKPRKRRNKRETTANIRRVIRRVNRVLSRRTNPVRKVSVKRKAQLEQYSGLREWFLSHIERCEACHRAGKQLDVHHKRGRSGSLLLRAEYWMAVCRWCHEWIHNCPELARQRGWLAQRGEWGKVG